MLERLLPAGPHHRVRVRCSDRDDGDFRVDGPQPALDARRGAFAPGPWTWLRQVHGSRVVCVEHPGAGAGEEADAAVTSVVGAVVAVHTADCVPIVLAGPRMVGVVHAGWRGIVDGVVPATVDAMRKDGSADIHAFVGPHIRSGHYAFGSAELALVAAVAGDEVHGHTLDGQPALDMTAAVDAVLRHAGVDVIERLDADTAAPQFFSHRVRSDRERQVTVAWLEAVGS